MVKGQHLIVNLSSKNEFVFVLVLSMTRWSKHTYQVSTILLSVYNQGNLRHLLQVVVELGTQLSPFRRPFEVPENGFILNLKLAQHRRLINGRSNAVSVGYINFKLEKY